MAKLNKEKLFRIAFLNHGKVYELFCKEVCSSYLLGFVEVSGLEFGEKDSLMHDRFLMPHTQSNSAVK